MHRAHRPMIAPTVIAAATAGPQQAQVAARQVQVVIAPHSPARVTKRRNWGQRKDSEGSSVGGKRCPKGTRKNADLARKVPARRRKRAAATRVMSMTAARKSQRLLRIEISSMKRAMIQNCSRSTRRTNRIGQTTRTDRSVGRGPRMLVRIFLGKIAQKMASEKVCQTRRKMSSC